MINHKSRFLIKDTKKYGMGVFALSDIKKGSIIYVLSGKKMDVNDFAKKVISGKEALDDPFQIGKRTYIDLDKFSRLFNHSCDPNGGIRKTSELFAIKDIKKGDEITYDYSLTISPTEWSMRCKCGTKKCRKVLGDILSVPKKRLNEYKKLGAIQVYMKPIIKEIENKSYIIPKYELWLIEELKK